MSATNQNQGNTDSLSIKQNSDGSYEINWDKEDPMWCFMNNLTSKEIQVMIEQALKEEIEHRDA